MSMKKTQLNDRVLWFDGDITVDPTVVLKFIKHVNNLYVSKLTSELIQYNKLATGSDAITIKEDLNDIDNHWNIPKEFNDIDIFQWILQKLQDLKDTKELNQLKYDIRLERAMVEYKEFKRLKLFPLLRTLLYIINTFERDNVVWGPGRGSSVSSYILYLIGVHDVDSVTYDLNVSDFMKDIQ